MPTLFGEKNLYSEVCPLGGFSQDSVKYACLVFDLCVVFNFCLYSFIYICILSIGQAFLLDAIVVQPFLAMQFFDKC